MPIYNKTSSASAVGNHNTADIGYHTSEAAKVKRTREQAYFNSYDFDAIEVLPYDDEEDEEEERNVNVNQRERERRQLKSIQTRQQQNKISQQQQPVKPQQIPNHYTSSNNFIVDNRQQHQPLHHVNSKYNPTTYLQRISGIFTSKANNNSNKPQTQPKQQPQQLHNQRNNAGIVCGVGNKDVAVAVAVNASSHENKHLKLSSSETSSTSLSSSSIVEEILNVDNVGDGSEAIVTSSGLLPLEYARDITGTGTRATTSDATNMNVKAGSMVTCTLAATTTTISSTSAKNAGNNFLLPRAMLKYQSSTLSTQQGVAGTTSGTTISMPLATNAESTSSINSPTNISRQKQQQQQRDVHKLETIKVNNAMMPTGGSITSTRLKKTSSSSSVITSLASGDIEEDRDLADNVQVKNETKVLPKNINTKASTRASSHQSHYSTEKSASSGYYSSNVCSTYSLEEHIYSEPTLDLQKLEHNAKESKLPLPSSTLAEVAATASAATTLQNKSKLQQHQPQNNNLLPNSSEANSVMRSLGKSRRHHYADTQRDSQTLASNRNSQEFNENLKILESSIENLDRHLKSFPGVNSQEALVNYAQNPYNPYASVNHTDKARSSSSYHQLPTIQESFDGAKKPSWPEDRSDDSLMDIDLDSFLLDKDKKSVPKSKKALSNKGVNNPAFLTEEQEENHYKCAKYINSCPEDAYRVESDIIAPARSSISSQSVAVSVDLYPKRYEEQLHFQNTRELLEDVRDKIRLLTQTQEADTEQIKVSNDVDKEDCIPKELHIMINTLKQELEMYLDRMNQHSELEIRQLCTGLVKNQHIVKMKNAFERRRSLTEAADIYSTYEAVQDGIVMNAQGIPISITQQITSIRCASDPNFKMKRKSLTEVFPHAECYVESLRTVQQQSNTTTPLHRTTQLQRNLSYHKPVLEQLKPANTNTNLRGNTASSGSGSGSGTNSGADTSEPNDKDSILDWHRKKPSIWEMYYGTNRIQQSLLGSKKNGMMVTTATSSSPSTMCYPSSRPESDFTLDLPRAEQLRIKMEKEKKFRQRCRVITTFLSLVFFLLTVMVVSLVLTRGKRMFGSMI